MRNEVTEKFATLITGAFGLIAALAWNSAIQGIFKQIFGEQSSIIAMLTYAVLVTIIAVLATLYIGKLSQSKK